MSGFFRRGLILLATAATLAACGGGDGDPTTTTSAAGPATTAGDVTTPTTPAGTSTSVPPSTDISRLTDLRFESIAGDDRLTFVFDGDQPPGYALGYVDDPIPSGEEGRTVDVGGDATLEVRLAESSTVDLTAGLRRTYTGPDRFTPAGASTVVEIAMARDFESVLTWAVGTRSPAPFRVTTASAPARIIVDF